MILSQSHTGESRSFTGVVFKRTLNNSNLIHYVSIEALKVPTSNEAMSLMISMEKVIWHEFNFNVVYIKGK